MADSIHDQWNTATSEWQAVATNFNRSWTIVFLAAAKNSDYQGFATAIDYLARMHQDTTVMAGDMITNIASTGHSATAGLVQNFQNLQANVLPAWGVLAARYVGEQVFTAVNQEASARQASQAQLAAELTTAFNTVTAQLAAELAAESAQRAAGDAVTLHQAVTLVAAEAAQRAAGDAATLHQAVADINAAVAPIEDQVKQVLAYAQSLPGLVDSRAAAGYDPTLKARGNLIRKLLDTVVAHDPLVAGLVSRLAGLIIDLAGVEDPVLRVAANIVLKQVIDKLGAGTALHAMLSDLLGGIIGGGQPKTLTAIMGDIGNRLDSLEETTAALAPLADEADKIHELGSVLFDAALLGYVTAAIANPKATADDTVAVLAPVTGPLTRPLRVLLGMP